MPHRTSRALRLISLAAVPALALVALAMAQTAPQGAALAASGLLAPPAPPAPPDPPPAPAPAAERQQRESRRPWLGVVLSGEDGATISSVAEDSPADQAGLRKGDRILEIDGKEVEDGSDVVDIVRSLNAGDRVRLRFERDGEEQTASVTIGEREGGFRHEFRYRVPGPAPRHEHGMPGEHDEHIVIMRSSRNYLGVEVFPMSDELRAALKAPAGSGVLVNKVVEDSPAGEAGIRAGDVILSVDGDEVEDSGDIGRALSGHDPGDQVAVKVIRDGAERTFDVKVAKRPEPAGRRGALWMPGRDGDDWEGMVGIDKEELQRVIEDAMRQARDAMKLYDFKMRENSEEIRELREQLRDQNEKIRRQIREEMERRRPTTRARLVFDI